MPELTEMKLGDAGASVAISLAAYGVMGGMGVFDALNAAERVLKAACVQEDKARGRRAVRMMGEAPVLEVMVAMGEVIDAQPGGGNLQKAFDADDDEAEACAPHPDPDTIDFTKEP